MIPSETPWSRVRLLTDRTSPLLTGGLVSESILGNRLHTVAQQGLHQAKVPLLTNTDKRLKGSLVRMERILTHSEIAANETSIHKSQACA